MQSFDTQSILLILVELVARLFFAAMLAADGWVIYRLLTRRPVLPSSPLVPRRPVPWGAWPVLLIALMSLLLPDVASRGYATLNGLIPSRSQARLLAASAQKPPAKPEVTQSPQLRTSESAAAPAHSQPLPANVQPPEQLKQAIPKSKEDPDKTRQAASSKSELKFSVTEQLVIQAIASVTLLILAPVILRTTTRSPLRDLGLSFEKWWLQAAVGAVAFLAIEPILLAIQFGTAIVWENREQHPLFKMVLDEFSPGVPQLAVLLAVFVAPMAEEMLFRGIIQSWVVSRFNRPRLEPASVLAESRANPAPDASTADSDGQTQPDETSEHALDDFQASLATPCKPVPTAPSTPLDQRPSTLAGIIAISLIFAALHWPQWPAPIPVFALAVGIGYVYQRTGSLIAAFCMHAMFNGISTLILLGTLLLPHSAQHPDSKTVKPAAIVGSFSTPRDCACIHCKK